jgi:hypothetical protein
LLSRRHFTGREHPRTTSGPVNWIGNSARFWYRKSLPEGYNFIPVDNATLTKRPAFDHAQITAALSKAAGKKYRAATLPFETIAFSQDERSLTFQAAVSEWTCARATSA